MQHGLVLIVDLQFAHAALFKDQDSSEREQVFLFGASSSCNAASPLAVARAWS